MTSILKELGRLWRDDDGFIVSAELVLISTILVLALIVGLTAVRTALTEEPVDVANAFGSLNQSFHSHDHGSSHNDSHKFDVHLHGGHQGE